MLSFIKRYILRNILNQGRNVEIILRSNIPNDKTPVTKIQRAFKQGKTLQLGQKKQLIYLAG